MHTRSGRFGRRCSLILTTVLLVATGWAAAAPAPEVEITVDVSRVRHTMRGGFGASWHAIEQPLPVVGNLSHGGSAWGANPPASDDRAWREICRHADWLGIDFVRVEIEQRIFEPERGKFTWDTPEMRILYRILDWCQLRGADVFLQNMWGNVEWNAFPEFRGDSIQRLHSGPHSIDDFANGLAALVKHLTQIGFNRWSFLNRGDLDGVWQMVDTWDSKQGALLKTFRPRLNSYFTYGLISRLTAKHSSL